MAELPIYPTDAAICRLLADGPLPTATIADRLGMPDRTVRHRLRRLREAGAVVSGSDGRHRLAGTVPLPTLVGSRRGAGSTDLPASAEPRGWAAVAVLAAAGIGLAAAAVIWAARPK